ncbi:YihA family ribosome biogenesis GTP-binding protein [Lujinxingia litoralis]|uniref:Probable GTP-binding protein EngB n=1 Tax=Lujinxingia litoralis TaxID=2211119 RepID=A0A328CCK2_9DELT|nr:ribosome biogenesis GTP-binding protein YihA/YsxC [Lujinxingia litoralis]RAL25456.1 YihA family ribosome biogenesis GTP-binding protein [Lujinxingia litoralis]
MSAIYKVTKAEFIKSGTRPSHFPPPLQPEIAFGGASNVGKSSLINSLVGRNKLVKTSKTPGHTQTINFFNINDELVFVDLPGYGFAKVPLEVKAAWGPMMERYLGGRPTLRAIVCVMDLRRGVRDDDMMLIESAPLFGIQPILVFTKADKFGKNAGQQRLREIARELGCPPGELVLYSSTNGQGGEQLWDRIRQVTGV